MFFNLWRGFPLPARLPPPLIPTYDPQFTDEPPAGEYDLAVINF